MINPETFIEKKWKRPVRIAAELGYGKVGSFAYHLGLNRDYPKKSVFIIGSPRSGTSIFNTIWSLHPDIADLSEAIYIWEPKDCDKNLDHIKTESAVTESDIARIRGAFGLFQRVKGKPCFVNKNPRSSMRIGFIHKIFPEAYFIHIVRDGRAVVNSILSIIKRQTHRQSIPLGGFCKPRDWKKFFDLSHIELHARQWVGIMNEIENSKHLVQKDRWIEIKYEAFCVDPCQCLTDVYNRIGLKANDNTLKNSKGMAKSQNFKWRDKFSQQELDFMNVIMSDWLNHYGYKD